MIRSTRDFWVFHAVFWAIAGFALFLYGLTYGLLEHFHNAANRVGNAPHPLANWYVIEGLSRQLLDGEPPADASGWKSIPKEQIRDAARRLLEEHDGLLASIGTATARGVINL